MWAQCKPRCAGSVIIAARLTASSLQKFAAQLRVFRRIIQCASRVRLPIPCGGHCICLELPMSSAANQSLINLLLESGVPSREESLYLATATTGIYSLSLHDAL